MNREFFLRHWYAGIYEQQVIQANEVDFILSIVGNTQKNILEVACGGGRISVPLAKSGHKVTGFDFDEFMLEKALLKGKGLSNLTYFKADAVYDDWGKDFDVVILEGNILLNIESDMDYQQAQQLFIKKAADSVKQDGFMYLDFDCYDRPDQTSDKKREWSFRRYEIVFENGEVYAKECTVVKHFPKLKQVKSWLKEAGWEIELLYGGYNKQLIDEKITGNRAII